MLSSSSTTSTRGGRSACRARGGVCPGRREGAEGAPPGRCRIRGGAGAFVPHALPGGPAHHYHRLGGPHFSRPRADVVGWVVGGGWPPAVLGAFCWRPVPM